MQIIDIDLFEKVIGRMKCSKEEIDEISTIVKKAFKYVAFKPHAYVFQISHKGHCKHKLVYHSQNSAFKYVALFQFYFPSFESTAGIFFLIQSITRRNKKIILCIKLFSI